MTFSLKNLLTARTFSGHLLLRVLLLLLFVGLLIYLFFPLAFWILFGEGASADRIAERPLSLLIADLLPLLIGLLVCFYKVYKKTKKGEVSNAKSYFVAGLILLVVYPFRLPIMNAVIELCLYVSDSL